MAKTNKNNKEDNKIKVEAVVLKEGLDGNGNYFTQEVIDDKLYNSASQFIEQEGMDEFLNDFYRK